MWARAVLTPVDHLVTNSVPASAAPMRGNSVAFGLKRMLGWIL
jgi:hypothetical protein